MKLAGWGQFPWVDTTLARPRYAEELPALLERSPSQIARGNGRSYGDAAVSPELTVDMRWMNRIQALDEDRGMVSCEAGMLLKDLLDIIIPRGWFVPVVPGTSLVTLGGMAAGDIHGKNHHVDGGFSSCVESLDLLCGDGVVRHCSRADHPELFMATLGGMGLTGIILRLTLRLRPLPSVWIDQEIQVARNLDAALETFEETAERRYSVAWIDCVASGAKRGRSLILLGEHAQADELPKNLRATAHDWQPLKMRNVPFHAPRIALNRFSVRAFNELYFRRGTIRNGKSHVGLRSYFFPLDALGHWNRLYGRRGFLQFQCVIPLESSQVALRQILQKTADSGNASMLAVLKRMGQSAGPLSFPMPGHTLAMDFPYSKSAVELLRELEAITIDHGGRINLTKDACGTAEALRTGYEELERFVTIREQFAAGRFRSTLSDRLEIT